MALGKLVTYLVFAIFFFYLITTSVQIWKLFRPTTCQQGEQCLPCLASNVEAYDVQIYSSKSQNLDKDFFRRNTVLWHDSHFAATEDVKAQFSVSIPLRKNAKAPAMYLHAFVTRAGRSPDPTSATFDADFLLHQVANMVEMVSLKDSKNVNTTVAGNLVNGVPDTAAEQAAREAATTKPVPHWNPRLVLHFVADCTTYPVKDVPDDIRNALMVVRGKYLPIFQRSTLGDLKEKMLPFNSSTVVEAGSSEDVHRQPMEVEIAPVALGKWRLWRTVENALVMMHDAFGLGSTDTDDIRRLFVEINPYLVGLTFFVSMVHMLFDYLSLKNDIVFWRNKSDQGSMVGISARSVVLLCVCDLIIFLNLWDNKDTSTLVLISVGASAALSVWKVTKALRLAWHVPRGGWLPRPHIVPATSKQEDVTNQYDAAAMRALSFILFPLIAGFSLYSLLYNEHKSWYSWTITSLANGVYALGFILMTPQLFINFKLKSVSQMPWRVFMYKAFNTFIDDLFAFIITMPTSHRVACFRDDLVFFVYLYQRWLYPVDKTRPTLYSTEGEDKKKTP